MNEDLLPIENFHGIFGRQTLARLNTMAEAVYRYVQMEPALIDRLVFDDDEPSSQGGATLVYPAKITTVQGAGIAATYNAVALNDATIVLANQTPVNRPFGVADIIEAAVDDKCLICLLPANPGDTSTVGFLVQLTEKAKFTNCQQQQPPPGGGANAPVTPANIGAPPKLSMSAMQAAGYTLNEQFDYLLSWIQGVVPALWTFFVTPSSANLAAAVTDETGTGKLVFASAPTLTAPVFAAGTASANTAPKLTSGTVNTTVEAGAIEYDGTNLYFGNQALNRGVVIAEYFARAHAAINLNNSALMQALFTNLGAGALTLPTGAYFFQAILSFSSMSATSGNGGFDILGAGTATTAVRRYRTGAIDAALNANGTWVFSMASNTGTPLPIASNTTATVLQVEITGTFEVTVAGTIIPSFQLANAAAAVLDAGSFIRIQCIGATTVTSVGQWS